MSALRMLVEEGRAVRIHAMPNGAARYPVFVFDVADAVTPLITTKADLSDERERARIIAELPDDAVEEAPGMLSRLAAGVAEARLSEQAQKEKPKGSASPVDAPAAPGDRTEAGNAARLVRLHGRHIRYVAKWNQFLVWRGGRWVTDDRDVLVTELAKDVGSDWIREAADIVSEKARDAAIAWGRTSLSSKAIANALNLARGIDGVAIDHELLDADPWLFGVENGVIELRTGALRNSQPSDLMTMQSPVPFDPGAEAPRWERAMAEWFPDPATRSYVQRAAGAAMVGEQIDHVLVIHYGGGRNGKGTFTRAVTRVFGPYARTPHLSLFVQQKHSEHDTVKADLFRCRLAIASETERRVSLAEASVKNLTGGDTITCRRMRENPWQFKPSHSLHLSTNYLPTISGQDTGVWSRIRVVPWESNFERKPDKHLDAALAAEAPGILAWLVRGCLEWQREGLSEPESVIRATMAYRTSEDVFARFASDTGLSFGAALTIAVSELNGLLDEWAKAEGAEPKRAEFTGWLKLKGARQVRDRNASGKQVRVWSGVGAPESVLVTSVTSPSVSAPKEGLLEDNTDGVVTPVTPPDQGELLDQPAKPVRVPGTCVVCGRTGLQNDAAICAGGLHLPPGSVERVRAAAEPMDHTAGQAT